MCLSFLYNDTATTEIYTLSLHDALPIYLLDMNGWDVKKALKLLRKSNPSLLEWLHSEIVYYENEAFTQQLRILSERSEEHTSELQSQSNLVCRLLLEKKK